jgi:hypothetical protein
VGSTAELDHAMKKKLLLLLGIEHQFLGHPGHDLVALLNELSQLSNLITSLNPILENHKTQVAS